MNAHMKRKMTRELVTECTLSTNLNNIFYFMFFLKCSANLFIRIVTIYTSFYADTILFYGRQVGNVDTFFL